MSPFKAKSKLFDVNQRIDMMLNPESNGHDNDKIKIMMHIDPMLSNNQYMRMNSLKSYMRANLEG